MALGGGEVVARARAVLTLDSSSLKKGLAQSDAAMKGSTSRMTKLGNVAGTGAMIGVAALTTGLVLSAKAAVGAQHNTDLLEQAVKKAGLSMKGAGATLDTFAGKQAKYGVSTSDAKGYLAQFVIATDNAHRSTQLLSLAEDIAAAKNVSLADAVSTVTKLQAGSTRIMTASGLIYQKTTTHVDALTAKYKALGLTTANMTPEQVKLYNAAKRQAQIEDKQANATNLLRIGFKKYGGDAAKASQTLEGKWKTLHAEAQNLEVTVGNKLLPAITKVTNWMLSHTGDVKAFGIAIAGITGFLGAVWAATKIYNAALKINAAYTTIAAGVQKLFGGSVAATGVEAEASAGQMTLFSTATGEAGAAGALGTLGPLAIAGAIGLGAYYKSTKPNISESNKLTASISGLNATIAGGSHTVKGFTGQMDAATRQGTAMMKASAKLNATVGMSGQASHVAAQAVSDYAGQMEKVATNAHAAAVANAKTNPTLSAGEQAASNYARAAGRLATELGRIPTKTEIQVDLNSFVTSSKGPQNAGLAHGAGGMRVPGSGHGDTVHAMLTPGEVVLNRGQQSMVSGMLGQDLGGVLGFASGGTVPSGFATWGPKHQARWAKAHPGRYHRYEHQQRLNRIANKHARTRLNVANFDTEASLIASTYGSDITGAPGGGYEYATARMHKQGPDSVAIHQYFSTPPEEPFIAMRRAAFAASATFS